MDIQSFISLLFFISSLILYFSSANNHYETIETTIIQKSTFFKQELANNHNKQINAGAIAKQIQGYKNLPKEEKVHKLLLLSYQIDYASSSIRKAQGLESYIINNFNIPKEKEENYLQNNKEIDIQEEKAIIRKNIFDALELYKNLETDTKDFSYSLSPLKAIEMIDPDNEYTKFQIIKKLYTAKVKVDNYEELKALGFNTDSKYLFKTYDEILKEDIAVNKVSNEKINKVPPLIREVLQPSQKNIDEFVKTYKG